MCGGLCWVSCARYMAFIVGDFVGDTVGLSVRGVGLLVGNFVALFVGDLLGL